MGAKRHAIDQYPTGFAGPDAEAKLSQNRLIKYLARVSITVLAFAPIVAFTLGGCVQTQWRAAGYGATQTMLSADQTMDVEVSDRINRLRRLANLQGVVPPQIEQVTLPKGAVPGANRPVPVIRVTFTERDFFESGSTAPRPEALRVLQVVAENMHRDVPDVRVTVLGHTDASGTDQQNLALSYGRAQSVIETLVASGVNPGQLSAIAIGRAQPIAPNNSLAGRAMNRRVEFLISPYEQANLAVVSNRTINPAFLTPDGASEGPARRQVAVLRPSYSGPNDVSEAPLAPARAGRLALADSGTPVTVGENESGSPVSVAARSTTQTSSQEQGETGSPVIPAAARFAPTPP